MNYIKILLAFLLAAFAINKASAQNFEWARKISGNSLQEITAMVTDLDGNVYTAGLFELKATFQQQTLTTTGGNDIFLAKYSKNGNLIWFRKAGSTNHDFVHGLVIDSKGNLYLTGTVPFSATFAPGFKTVTAELFMAKYDSSGNIKWLKKLSNYYRSIYAHNTNKLAISAKDEIYFTDGYQGSKITFGGIKLPETIDSTGTNWSQYISRLDTSGKVQWVKIVATEIYSNTYGREFTIATDKDGDIYLAGKYQGEIYFYNKRLESKYNRRNAKGYITFLGGGIIISRIGKNGELKWMHNLSEKYICLVNSSGVFFQNLCILKVTDNKDVYLGGTYCRSVLFPDKVVGGTDDYGPRGAYIGRYDSAGNFKWVKEIRSWSWTDYPYGYDLSVSDIAFRNNQEFCVAGTYWQTAYFDNISISKDSGINTFIALYDTSGKLKNVIQPVAFAGNSEGGFLAHDHSDSFYLSGQFLNKIKFGPDTLTTQDTIYPQYAYLTKFNICATTPVILPAGPLNLCSGDSVTLTINNIYSKYRWYRNGSLLPSATKNSFTVRQSGLYTVFTDSGTCAGVSNNVKIHVGNAVNLGGNKTLCAGESVLLYAGDFSGYIWNDNSHRKTLLVKESGKYFVTVTDTLGCVSADTVFIQVNALSKPAIQFSPAKSLCYGDSVKLFTEGNYLDLQWYKNNKILPGETTKSLITNDTGKFTLWVKDINGCWNADSIVINWMLRQPQITALGPTIFCEGESVVLAAPRGYSNYTWLKNDTLVGNSHSDTLLVNEKGKYKLLADSNGCGVVSNTILVTTLPKTEINLPDTVWICTGEHAELDAGADFLSYSWSNHQTSRTIKVGTTGLYSVTAKNASGCISADKVWVKVRNNKAGITLRNDTLFASSAEKYHWFFENEIILGASENFYVPLQTGIYSVKLVDRSGCQSQSETFQFENNTNNWLTIYPNPAHGKVTLQLSLGINTETVVKIALSDALGKQLITSQVYFNSNFDNKMNLDVSSLAEGVYYLRVHAGELEAVRKIVKLKN